MLTGSENTLAAAIKTDLDARILASTGSPVATPNANKDLTDAIAFQIIPHFLSNAQVTPGTFSTSSGPVTGIGGLL